MLLALALLATPARYGGQLSVLAPASALDGSRIEPGSAHSPLELALARMLCEPLYRVAANGELAPDLAALPRSEGPRLLSMRLRAGTGATEVVASLGKLAAAESPYRALLLPLSAALSPRGEGELTASFAFPYPDWSLGLAQVGACPSKRSGPFTVLGKFAPPQLHLTANLDCAAGRPFADTLVLRSASPRSAARALASGEGDLALLPLPEPAQELNGPLSVATYLAVNPRKPQLAPVATALAARLDRAELVRIFVRGPAQPLYGLLAPSVEPHPLAAPPRVEFARSGHLGGELLVDASGDVRAVAERLQVKLHDLGIDLRVVALPRAELSKRIGAGDYDAALVAIPALPEPGLNLAQVLLLAEPEAQVKTELAAIGALPDRAARRERASARARELLGQIPVVPLYAQGLAVSVRPGVHGLSFDGAGLPDLGAVWTEGAR